MKKGYWAPWLRTLVGATGGIITAVILVPLTGGGSLILGAIAVGSGVTGGLIGYGLGGDKSADWDAGIFLVPNKANILKDLKCDILPAGGEIE